MPPFVAAQHFFSSVPAEQSPTKRRGYQTLFRTRVISDEIARAIEDRAQYTTAPGDPIKRQFYSLPGDFFAISQSVALAELDEFGRKGRYLAHTLIVERRTLDQLGGCPLDVLRQYKFSTSLAEVFAQREPNRAEVPSVRLEITPQWQTRAVESARSWKQETLIRLGRLAWQANQLIEKREAAAIIGSDSDQFSALEVLFLLASPVERSQMSFDTHAVGCEWGRGVVFWMQGFANDSDTRAPNVVEARTHEVKSSLVSSDDGAFGTWMVKDGFPINAELPNKQTWAMYLSAILSSSAGSRDKISVPPAFSQRYARLNASAVASRWAFHLPQGLTSEIVQTLLGDVLVEPGSYLSILAEGVKPQDIQEFMLTGLLKLGATPAKTDRQVLEKWIKEKAPAHLALQSFLPLWAKDGNGWARALSLLSTDDYELILSSLTGWRQHIIPLWESLVGRHVKSWMNLVAPFIPVEDWKKKIFPILEKSNEELLADLAQVTPYLSREVKLEIAKWLKGYKGKAKALREALGVEKEDKEGKGLFGF